MRPMRFKILCSTGSEIITYELLRSPLRQKKLFATWLKTGILTNAKFCVLKQSQGFKSVKALLS